MSFTSKVVLVTGGSSGIGASTAILFAKEGADVAIVGRNEEKLKSVAAKMESVGNKPLVIKADVSKDDEAKSIIKQTLDKFGRLDVLVNNAGIMKSGTILDGTIISSYDELVSVNLRAVIQLTILATPHLVASKGNIINVSSVAGIRILPSVAFLPYCITKAGLDHFSRGAAIELASSGVRVNSVNPGPVRTDLISPYDSPITYEEIAKLVPLNKISEPEEIANLILFLGSDKAKSITGSIFVCDNGDLLK